MFQLKVVEKIKIHVLCSLNFSPEYMPFMENVEKYVTARQATSENMMRRLRFACRMTKAADPVRLCNTYCFSTATVVTRTRLIVTLCVNWQSVSQITLYNII
jgi:UDP-N-acetylmuramoylalanine-D-glutamate ligase